MRPPCGIARTDIDLDQYPRRFTPLQWVQHRLGGKIMYWDEAVVFGLVTVGLLVAFMGGLLAFVVHDNKRSKGKRPQ